MNAPSTSTLTSAEEIRRALELLIKPGEVFEIRAWGCLPRFKKGVLSGYFDDLDKATAAAVALSQGGTLSEFGRNEKTVGAEGVYIVLNPVEPALLGRSANRLRQAEGGDTTGDQHITRRRWLLVDCDPVRVSGISSSDAEKIAAHAKAKEIARNLRESFGFPAPVLADSGNGWHLLYRIELPADDAARIEAFLKALAARFDSEAVHVDKKVFNASRICKLYGTAARKGDSIPDRPHRESRIEFIPEPLEVVTPELLDSVIVECLPVEEAPRADRTMRGEGATYADGRDLGIFPMEAFIGRHGLDAGPGKPYKSGTRWQITCPFDSSHKKPDAALYVTSDGKPGFTCSHDSCSGRDMKALAAHLRDTEVLARFEKRANKSNKSSSPIGGGGNSNREREEVRNPLYKREFDKFDKISEWDGEPSPIGSESLPAFPLTALPVNLRRFAVGVSASVGTAPDLPSVLLLAAIATAAQKSVAVRGKRGHVEQLTLWTVSIAPPGSRKSPIMARIRQPFATHEARENEKRKPEIERYESEERVARKRLDAAEASMARAGEGAQEAAGKALTDARNALKDVYKNPARPLRLLVDDATPEAVAVLLSENSGRLAVLDAEGAIFGHMAGRYTDKPSIETFLKSWSGEDFTSDRAGKERRTLAVRRPALTLGVAVQPGVISSLRGKKDLVGVGALARCLFSFANDSDAADEYDTPDVPEGVEAEYRELIAELLALEPSLDHDDDGERLPYFVGLDDDARAAFSVFYSEIRAEIHAEGEGIFAEWLAKCHGQTLRIAGVLHLAKHGKIGAEKPIDAETIEGAFKIARYFMAHARAALARIREDDATEDARRVLAWVKRNPNSKAWQGEEKTITLRELRRQIRSIATEDEMIAALEVLLMHGYAREIEQEEKPEGTPGRRKGAAYQFHPSVTWGILE